MAGKQQNQPARARSQADQPADGPDLSGPLHVVGAPVVVLPDGSRPMLGGELTDEQREQLGPEKVKALHASGHLQTQEQIDEADALRRRTDENRRRSGIINPNFGTPSMTPEAAEKFEAPALGEGLRQREPDGDGRPTGDGGSGGSDAKPVEELGLETRTVNALKAAGLNTVGDVLRYGEDNDGLQSLEGIGEASEKEIQEAIDALDA